MAMFIHGQAKSNSALIKRICDPHKIDPQWVSTITISGVGEDSKYLIEYFNEDNHFCTIEVHGEIPEEKRKVLK